MIGTGEGGEVITQVYVDLLILVNLVMDFLILWATGKLAGLKTGFWRLTLGALVGAAYSLVVFFPDVPLFSSAIAKVLCSVCMILVAFAPLGRGSFIRSVAYLYLISFAMGGAVVAVMYLKDQPYSIQVINGVGVSTGDFRYSWLAAGIGVAILLGYGGFAYVRSNWLQQSLLHGLTIYFKQQEITILALLDTGNLLLDPLSHSPVIVVEAQALQSILPASLLHMVRTGGDEYNLQGLTPDLEKDWGTRLRVIPFNSVGRSHGLLLGFRPDGVEIRNKGKTFRRNDVIIGLINRKLTMNGRYQALINPEMLRQES